MKIILFMFAISVIQIYADDVPEEPNTSNEEYTDPKTASQIELRKLIIAMKHILDDLPEELCKHPEEVIRNGQALISHLPTKSLLGVSSRAMRDVFNNLNDTVALQLKVGAAVIRDDVVDLVKNASMVLGIADTQMNRDAFAVMDLLKAAAESSTDDSTNECLESIRLDLVNRTLGGSVIILDCVYNRISAAKDLVSNMKSLAESTKGPLDDSIKTLEDCVANTTSSSRIIDQMKTATCLFTVSTHVLTTESYLGIQIFEKIANTLNTIELLSADLSTCINQEFLDSIVNVNDAKEAINACS